MWYGRGASAITAAPHDTSVALLLRDLGGGGGDLAWSGNCGYVKTGDGIKAADVSDPTAPKVTATMPGRFLSENIHAVTTPERALLVAAGVGPDGPGGPGPGHGVGRA
jgi:hypothetical protein